MGFFKSIFSQQRQAPEKYGGSYFYPIGLADNIFGSGKQLEYFLEIPELNAILNLKARSTASGVVDVLSDRTGEPIPNTNIVAKIIRNPNWFQSQKEFFRQTDLFRSIYGNEFIYFNAPLGTTTFKGMFTLDPGRVKIEYSSDNPYFHDEGLNVKYKFLTNNGTWITLDKSRLIHLNDNRVQSKNILEGTSKINSITAPLENIIAAYKKRNIVLRMPVGIIANASTDAIAQAVGMTPEEKQQAQDDLRNHGALPFITNLSVKYTGMQVNSQQLGLFEETREDTGRICDAYGVPYELLASIKGNTLNDRGGALKEARKQMYEESIIPDQKERINAINKFFDTETKTWSVDVDFKGLPLFSDDLEDRASTLDLLTTALDRALESGAITVEQYQKELSKFGI